MKTVARIQYGSHLYGTNTLSSDLDFKSIHIPDAEDILLQQAKPEIVLNAPDKAEGQKNKPGDVDDKSFSLQHFLGLAEEGQTVALDMLFAPAHCVLQTSGWWRYLLDNRHRLISKKSAAFLGYCRQQANKYGIKGSRVAAAKSSSEIFSELAAQYPQMRVGDFDEAITRLIHENEHCTVTVLPVGSSGALGKFLDVCGSKVAYTVQVREAAKIFTRIYENYGDRAKLAQNNEGVDWKALSHAVRVGGEAIELLTTGRITLPLVNAGHIRDIKLGRLPYQQVSEEIENLLFEVEEAAKVSVLPEEPDLDFIHDTIVNAYGNRVHDEHCVKHYLDAPK